VKLVDISGTKGRNTWKLQTNIKIRNIRVYRGINDFKSGTNTVKVEKGDLVTDSHSILWKNHFSQLLNVCGVIDFRNTCNRTTSA
jgi:hypothetical protein